MKYSTYSKMKDSGIEWLGEIPEHWIVDKLIRNFEVINGGTPKSSNNEYWNGKIVWITPADLSELDSAYINSSNRRLSEKGIQNSSANFIPENSIVISKRAPIGYVAISNVVLSTNQGCYSLVKKNNDYIDIKYFYYFIKSIESYLKVLGQGSTFSELSSNDLGEVKLLFPSLKEQKLIANFLYQKTERIDKLIKKKEKLIELLEEKRQAILNKAVTKGLDPDVLMKDSGIEWLGEIPDHWEVLSIKYLLEVKDGTHDTPDFLLPSENTFPLVTTKDINNNEISFEETKHISEEDYKKINRRSNVEKNDILMPMIGTIGNPVIVKTDRSFSIKNVALFKTSQSDYITELIYYFLESKLIQIQFDLMRSGGVQSFVSLEMLRNLKVIIMPKREQKQIVNYLDKKTKQIDTLSTKIQKQISNLKEYRQALITNAVTGKIDVRDLA